MIVRIFTATMVGLQPTKIEVELDSTPGIPHLVLIGLASKAIDEAKERILAALLNCGVKLRNRRTVVNLAPADLRKTGSSFELAIAIGLAKLAGIIEPEINQTMFFGELSLEGDLKPLRGALPLVLAAKQLGFKAVVLPAHNVTEVSTVTGIDIFPIHHLKQCLEAFSSNHSLPRLKPKSFSALSHPSALLPPTVSGHDVALRALEIAATGRHHILMTGPPGAGKSLLARQVPYLLPPLSEDDSLVVTSIHSLSTFGGTHLITQPPFRSPHHTISTIGLIGGGSNLKPGEISLAHRGVLFLDELAEFSHHSLEALRQPLEEGKISLSRAQGTITYPANFMLVAAMNPCVCGFFNSSKICSCTPTQISHYQHRLSGPLLDRFDLKITVESVETTVFTDQSSVEHASKIEAAQKRVLRAQRFSLEQPSLQQTSSTVILQKLHPHAQRLLNQASRTLKLSTRSYFKTIKVSQTIAHLTGEESITETALAEALHYR